MGAQASRVDFFVRFAAREVLRLAQAEASAKFGPTYMSTMRSMTRTGLNSRWPFWLLVFGWFCASYPLALVDTLVWLGEARTFSHQQRLETAVARLMAEVDHPSLMANSVSTSSSPAEPARALNVSSKKIELVCEEFAVVLRLDAPAVSLRPAEFCLESAMRGPPPHEPPRRFSAS